MRGAAVALLLAALAPRAQAQVTRSQVPCLCQTSNCTVPPVFSLDLEALHFAAYAACPHTIVEPEHWHAHEAVLAPAVVLGVGVLLRHVLLQTGLPIPYTVTLLVTGAGLGLLLRYYNVEPLELAAFDGVCVARPLWSDVLQRSIALLGSLDPHLLLHIFIPPLLFESAVSARLHATLCCTASRHVWFTARSHGHRWRALLGGGNARCSCMHARAAACSLPSDPHATHAHTQTHIHTHTRRLRPHHRPPAAWRSVRVLRCQSAIEWHTFYQLKWASLLLAVPGVIASTFALGAVINVLYGNQV